MRLETKLEDLSTQKTKILKKIDKRNQQRKIKCASCNKLHMIGSLNVIQTHWYTGPYGCTGGDYWNEGELQFICPTTNRRNRLLFSSDWDYEERQRYDANKEFKRKYKHLFKTVTDSYEKDTNRTFDNNEYIDKNRKRFGLVEKRKI